MNKKKIIGWIIILNLLILLGFTVKYLFWEHDNYTTPINEKVYTIVTGNEDKYIDKWYNLISNTDWIWLYQDNTWDISVIDIDLSRAKVSFGWVDQVNKKLIKKTGSEWFINKAFEWRFARYNLVEESEDTSLYNFNRTDASETFWNFSYFWERKNRQYLFAAVNWQFFNANNNPTFLSFPVKSNWKILSSYVDNEIPKKTIIIDKNNKVKILEWYKKEYLDEVSNKELLVAFTPDVIARKDSKIWRSYIWIIWDNNIIFFIAKNKSQDDMNKIISDYWVKKEDIIMLDWWPSAQFVYYEWMVVNNFYWEWGVPHYFMIYTD